MKNVTEILADPEIFRINTVAPHSSHRHRLPGRPAFISLSGSWRFCYSPTLDTLPSGFEREDFDCCDWPEIKVPGHIQMQGWGVPQYTNIMYPWDGHENVRPGQIPGENPTGSYIRCFDRPDMKKGERLHLILHGAESGAAVWVNGAFIGYSEDSFTPSEFDITSAVHEGTNRIAVQVYQRTSGSWLEDQDFWRFSGLFRDVELAVIPECHICDIFVHTVLSDDMRSAEISAEIKMEGSQECGISAFLFSPEYELLEKTTVCDDKAVFSVDAPELWSAERPALYKLILTVRDRNGEITETIEQTVGLRRFAIEDGLLKLNGKPVFLKGVNRHEFSAENGRAVSDEEIYHDLLIMKQNNINAVRTSHYPNRDCFYDFCDRLGLYVIDETNLETHGTWSAGDDSLIIPDGKPEWREAVLARAEAMLERDKNHPCVLMWSCGNESFGGENIFLMSEFFRSRDPGRPVHYEGVFNDRRFNSTSDVESRMYPRPWDIEEYLRNGGGKPFICCEFSHAMGNSCGGLSKYTDLARREPGFQGMFVWDFMDQALLRNGRLIIGGEAGDRPSDYHFCGNGLIFADRTPSPKMAEVKADYAPFRISFHSGDILIFNENLFTGTENAELRLCLALDGEVVECRTEDMPEILPGDTARIADPFPGFDGEGEFIVTAAVVLRENTDWAPAGHEIAFGQDVRKCAEKKPAADRAPRIVDGIRNMGIYGNGYSVLFDKWNGVISSWKSGDRELIAANSGIPRPNFWRAPTDNDNGWKMQEECAFWKCASLYQSASVTAVDLTGNCAEICTAVKLPLSENTVCNVRYRFFMDRAEVSLELEGGKGILPDFGMIMKLPGCFNRLRWYGRGPAESAADRKNGCRLGLFESTPAEQVTAYLVPQECGSHHDVRFAELTDSEGRGLRVSGEFEFSALPYTPHELECAGHIYELPAAEYTVLRVSAGQCGVGGDDSWGARPHDEFIRRAEDCLPFTFTIRPVSG